jgi:hypothetical protein
VYLLTFLQNYHDHPVKWNIENLQDDRLDLKFEVSY